MRAAPRVIASFMAGFDNTFKVDTVTDLGEDPANALNHLYKLESCVPGYGFIGGAANGYVITDSGIGYITVTSDTALTEGTYTLDAPVFKHGTQAAVKKEIGINAQNLNYPFVYLQELEEDELMLDVMSAIGVNANVRLWFLLPNQGEEEVTVDKYSSYIDPMYILAEAFIDQIRSSQYVGPLEGSARISPHANAGSSSEYKFLKDLFDIPMSGVLLKITLPIKRQHCQC